MSVCAAFVGALTLGGLSERRRLQNGTLAVLDSLYGHACHGVQQRNKVWQSSLYAGVVVLPSAIFLFSVYLRERACASVPLLSNGASRRSLPEPAVSLAANSNGTNFKNAYEPTNKHAAVFCFRRF